MLHKFSIQMLIGVFCLSLVLAGCGPQADLKLKFEVDDSTVYKVSSNWVSSLRFEQPTAGKLEEKETGADIEMKFTEQIESVDEEGNAIARITIKAIKYLSKIKNEISFDFDSEREADQKEAFANLIGQSYTIKISPGGSVEVDKANKARKAVKGDSAARAKAFLNDENIKKRHEILALPDVSLSLLSPGYSWTRIKPSHPALKWAPKSLAKTYTLEKITSKGVQQVANISMNGLESEEPAEDAPKGAGLIGPFGNMFDPEEKYTGGIVLDLNTGKVLEYNEKFVGTYTIMDFPKGQETDKGPDVLTMGFTHEIGMEKVD